MSLAIGNVGKRRDAATDRHAVNGHAARGDATGHGCESCDKLPSHDTSRIAWADPENPHASWRTARAATEAGAGRFEKPAPDARAAPPEADESLIDRKAVEEVPLTGPCLKAPPGVVTPSAVY
jgi:hypothetical protein